MRSCRIGVVGFGIAGGAAAAFLARQGHKVTILERAPQLGPVGAGLLLQVSGQSVLKRLGVLQRVLEASEPLAGLQATLPSGRSIVRLRYEDAAPAICGYGVHRAVLFDAIRHAAEESGAGVLLNTEITDWRIGADGVIPVTGNGEEAGAFDLLVAADGARSALRSRIAPGRRAIEYAYGAMWMIGRNTQVRGELRQVVSGTNRLLGLLPIGDGRCTLFWGLRVSEMEGIREGGYDAWRNMATGLSPLAAETLADADSFDAVTFTTYRHSAAFAVSNGQIVCLGDAAHPMSPHLGQGANLALMDAACFADTMERADSITEAIERFNRARSSSTRYYAALSRCLTPFFQSDLGVLAPARNIALPLMCAFPPLRREMTRAMAGLKEGLFRSLPAL